MTPRDSDDVVAGQIAYYRRRAGEYDATAYGDVAAVRPRVARLVDGLAVSGSVLEIACGTGVWTEQLARTADSVLALDAAPETLEIARDRIGSDDVRFEVADVFAWTTPDRFDVIFFSAWLSHVPADRFEEFWALLRGLLTPGGRVLFIDEHVDAGAKEAWVEGHEDLVERRLADGTTHRIVKTFIDPARLEGTLARLGWTAQVQRDGDDWIVGEARPTT